MKLILSNEDKVVKYLFEDDKAVALSAAHIVVGDAASPDFIIGDMNSTNATLVEGVTEPSDWFGCKFKYVDNAWAEVEGWEDPRLRDGE